MLKLKNNYVTILKARLKMIFKKRYCKQDTKEIRWVKL